MFSFPFMIKRQVVQCILFCFINSTCPLNATEKPTVLIFFESLKHQDSIGIMLPQCPNTNKCHDHLPLLSSCIAHYRPQAGQRLSLSNISIACARKAPFFVVEALNASPLLTCDM